MKLFDLIGVIHKLTLPLVRSYQAEDGCTVFEFDITDRNITWKPGQHGIFTLPDKKITGSKWRTFSISSIPTENIIQIATKISAKPSSFKAALLSLKPGENITLHGPFGWMYLRDKHSPLVMIAGGVGITPFRSLFKALEQENNREVKLIYSARDSFLYQKELDEIASKDQKIKISYANTKEETGEIINKTLEKTSSDTYYFLSGAPSMVKDTTENLRRAGISKSKIVTDSFRGYR